MARLDSEIAAEAELTYVFARVTQPGLRQKRREVLNVWLTGSAGRRGRVRRLEIRRGQAQRLCRWCRRNYPAGTGLAKQRGVARHAGTHSAIAPVTRFDVDATFPAPLLRRLMAGSIRGRAHTPAIAASPWRKSQRAKHGSEQICRALSLVHRPAGRVHRC